MTATASWTWGLLAPALLIAAIYDIHSRRIPDWVTLPAIVALLCARMLLEGLGDLEHGLVSGAVGAVLAGGFFALWALGGHMGWGDVKLMGAVGAAFGFPAVQGAAIFVTLVGALQALVLLLWQGELWKTLENALSGVAGRFGLRAATAEEKERKSVPYGLAIALGSFWTMWWERAALVAQ